ncbi:MAG: 2-C-methyl-D-erythritol 2,4-cyclodiphosphate synthase [Dehalococcoidales bacterium]|nr:2-C-methyl-D-erythritol 2,4-cyclodiphosphate synthase [Dehalococcoidales bacterium]
MQFGIGFDIHPLVKGRKLVLGGVEIPFELGLDGWSDADVLVHAVIDALLGATAMGDIGTHFPPGKPEYKNISSLKLLGEVKNKLTAAGWQINNIDATVIAEKPRLSEYIDPMREQLQQALGIPIEQVSVKASTANQVGALGNEEAIAALAIASVQKAK